LIEQTAKIGISNASVLNLNNGEMNLDNSTIVMDEELVKEIKFIKEGSFVERDGDPTLRLVGNIKNIKTFDGVVVNTPRLQAIEQEDIVRAFLKNSIVEAPLEFIKVITSCSSGFQPIYFYIKQSGMSINEILEYIDGMSKNTQTIKLILQRLKGRREEQQTPQRNETESSQNKFRYLHSWVDKQIENIVEELDNERQDTWFLQSFLMIDSDVLIKNSEYYKNILFNLYERRYKYASPTISSYFRKVLCRLDEVLYFEQNA